jgi:hypothetical protein
LQFVVENGVKKETTWKYNKVLDSVEVYSVSYCLLVGNERTIP